MYKELTTSTELENAINDNIATLVYFYSDKCAPCISLRPKVAELITNKYSNMELVFVNSDKYSSIPVQYNVFANPTLIVFFEAKEYKRESKYISIPQLSEIIDRPYNMVFE
jgi:thioredoxin 1